MGVTLTGTVERIMSQKNDWAFFSLKTNEGSIACTCVPAAFEVGDRIRAEIEETISPKYGRGYKVVRYEKLMKDVREGIIRFLASKYIKGIGPAIAERIYEKFGDDAFDIIEKNPGRLAEVKGISEKKAIEISASFAESEKYRKVMQATSGVLTDGQYAKLMEEYGEQGVLDILYNTPYKIMYDLDGFGFLKTDQIAMKCGISKFNETRIQEAILYVLDGIAGTNGDCYVTIEKMQQTTMELLNRFPQEFTAKRFNKTAAACAEAVCTEVIADDAGKLNDSVEAIAAFLTGELKQDESVIGDALRKCIKSGQVTKEQESLLMHWIASYVKYSDAIAMAVMACENKGTVIIDGDKIASTKLYKAESDIARLVNHYNRYAPERSNVDVASFLEKYERENNIQLAKEQKEAVGAVFKSRLSIITGGPGCGKTTNIQTIISAWDKFIYGDIVLMAPTGRAAQRIKEKVQVDDHIHVGTIHKMAGINSRSGMESARDSEGAQSGFPMFEPEHNTLVICDEASMVDVFLARKLLEYAKDATLILVGDADQLPPVGAGNFFKDLIRSETVLTTRLTIGFRNEGLIAHNADKIKNGRIKEVRRGEGFDIQFLEKDDMAQKICDEYMAEIRKGTKKKDLCILTMQKKRGNVSTESLNRLIQSACAGISPDEDRKKFIEGDRVMQIKNDYQMPYVMNNGEAGEGVFNGDTGTVLMSHGDDLIVVEFDDGRVCTYDASKAVNLVLAYAITVHKSQGSEYKKIWIAVAMEQYIMLYRSIIYTAVTRAAKEETIICEKEAMRRAVTNVGTGSRNTRLVDFLCA